MRKTGPVTGKEVTFNQEDELVSATDPKGVITYANDKFCKVAKYHQEELIGQAHNLLRHPDMPAAAFESLWDTIKQGKPWLGAVKNRCKDGDHYWVSAYVTPALVNGKVVGYESVRSKADAKVIARAESCYARINNDAPAIPSSIILWQKLDHYCYCFALLAILGLISTTLFTQFDPTTLLYLLLSSAIGALPLWHLTQSKLKTFVSSAQEIINDPLATYIYTGRTDAQGIVLFAQLAQKERLRTALGRFGESAKDVLNKADQVQHQSENSHQLMKKQQEETTNITTAIQQMTQAVSEVAENASQASSATKDTVEQLQSGDTVLQDANRVINTMLNNISDLSRVIGKLKDDSNRIGSVVDVIRGIAEQTNLLALNAAIEAARAGEQGRGFAVVADEVRTLAQRTQESTQHIQEMIEALENATDDAEAKMQNSHTMAERSVEEVSKVGEVLTDITTAVNNINNISQQIAVAAEEQSVVSAEIDNNTKAISAAAQTTRNEAAQTAVIGKELNDLAQAQFDLIKRFS